MKPRSKLFDVSDTLIHSLYTYVMDVATFVIEEEHALKVHAELLGQRAEVALLCTQSINGWMEQGQIGLGRSSNTRTRTLLPHTHLARGVDLARVREVHDHAVVVHLELVDDLLRPVRLLRAARQRHLEIGG